MTLKKPLALRAVLFSILATTFIAACGAPMEEAGEEERRELSAGGLYEVYEDSVDGEHADHLAMYSVLIQDSRDAARIFGDEGRAVFEYPDAFQQVGLRLEATEVDELSFRAYRDGSWSDWEAVDIFWSEEDLHNGLILLEKPTRVIELRGAQAITFAAIEFFPEIIARKELIRGGDRAPEIDFSEPHEDLRTTQQASVAPASLVTSRAKWGAISPNKVCGNVVRPYRMAIHHTAVPDSDGNLYATMRGMQNYHMNSLGWCDIGYHFVVAQSGEILQGRSRADRPGAHVGNQNAGNVGISLIGNYQSRVPPQKQLERTAEIVSWVHKTYGVPLNRTSVKGHREHSGQSTNCPGNQVISRMNDILNMAKNGTTPPEPTINYDAELSIKISGLENFYTQGTSASVPDGLGGETFTAEIILSNKSNGVIRGTTLGYEFDKLGLIPTNYRIETDHPAYDKSTWKLNDANDNPDNPAKAQMGSSGTLQMHAFSAKESKRVVIEFKTNRYNIGFGDFSGIRAWVKNIDNVYTQASFGASPNRNSIGHKLEKHARVDILSASEWQFKAGQPEDLEGWTGGGAQEQLKLNTTHNLLAQKVTDGGAWIESPEWTLIDGDSFDELVIRARSHDGEHTKVVYFAGPGEEFDESRAVRFKAQGDGEYQTYVIPLGLHPLWGGEIDQLRLILNEDLPPGEDGSGWYDVDYIYFQNYQTGKTSSADLDLVDQEAEAIDIGEMWDEREPQRPERPGDGGPGANTGADKGLDGDSQGVRTNDGGCAVAGAGGSAPDLSWLLAVGLGFIVMKRRRKA